MANTHNFASWMMFIAAACPMMAKAQPQQGQAQQSQAPALQLQPPRVVATVNGDPITQQEVDISVQRHLQQLQAQNPQQQISRETIQQVKPQAIDELIESRLVEQYVIEEGPSVDEQEVKASVDQLKRQLTEQGSSFQQFLASQGHTMESFLTRIKGSIAWHKYQQEELTDAKLQQFFQQNQERFDSPSLDQVRQKATQAYVDEVWKQIVAQMKPDAEIRTAGQQTAQPSAAGPAVVPNK